MTEVPADRSARRLAAVRPEPAGSPRGAPTGGAPTDRYLTRITLTHTGTPEEDRSLLAALQAASATAGLIDLDAERGRITWTFDRGTTDGGVLGLFTRLIWLAEPFSWGLSIASARRPR